MHCVVDHDARVLLLLLLLMQHNMVVCLTHESEGQGCHSDLDSVVVALHCPVRLRSPVRTHASTEQRSELRKTELVMNKSTKRLQRMCMEQNLLEKLA